MKIEVKEKGRGQLAVTLDNIIYAGYTKPVSDALTPFWCIRCLGSYVIRTEELDLKFFVAQEWQRFELGEGCFVYSNPRHMVCNRIEPDPRGFVWARFADGSQLSILVDETAQPN
jgi:hypothetical protein